MTAALSLNRNPSNPPPPSHEFSVTLPSTGFIRERQLLKIIAFSHSTLWRKVADGTFPVPVKLSERVTAWRVEDVRAWRDKQH